MKKFGTSVFLASLLVGMVAGCASAPTPARSESSGSGGAAPSTLADACAPMGEAIQQVAEARDGGVTEQQAYQEADKQGQNADTLAVMRQYISLIFAKPYIPAPVLSGMVYDACVLESKGYTTNGAVDTVTKIIGDCRQQASPKLVRECMDKETMALLPKQPGQP